MPIRIYRIGVFLMVFDLSILFGRYRRCRRRLTLQQLLISDVYKKGGS